MRSRTMTVSSSQWSLTFEVRKRLGPASRVGAGNLVAMEPDL